MADDARSRTGGRLTGFLPVVVVLILLVASVGGFAASRRLVGDQEDRLLEERASEVALVLNSSISRSQSTLGVLASLLGPNTTNPADAFREAAERIGDGAATVYAIASDGRVTASGQGGPAVGSTLTGTRADVVRRARNDDGLHSAKVVDGDRSALVLAVAGDGVIVVQETPLQPEVPLPTEADSPFSELRAAVYASDEADAASLILTTDAELPLRGDVQVEVIDVGADRWTLVVAPRRSLVGDFARQAPWLLLGAGAVAAILAGAITTVLARRRSYALALVAERTADLRQAQEAAEQANRSKSEFLSRMSHELRTPLNAVLGFGQLLEMDDLRPEQRDAVAHILKAGQHLLQLINEVLDITRVETGNIALSPEAVLAGDLLEESIDLLRPLADQRGIQVVADRSGGWERHVFADRQRAKQVILNLLSNAVKYNRLRGTVAVSCVVVGDGRAQLRVSDTGPGIRPEHLEMVFLPFERIGAEHSDVEGTGIGLALSRHLAEAMGGNLGIESTPGAGSTFWLELPLVENPVGRYERLHAEDAPVKPVVTPERRTILHIEDNLSNVKLVERVLAQRPEVEVVAAMQGRLGVELAREHRPLLVLLDLHLPDMSGEAVLERLRDDPITASTPVVIVSADATPGQVQRLLAAGAAAYLTKPIDVRELLRLLDDALAVH